MPRSAKPLTDALIRRTKPAARFLKLFDGAGLYLEISPSGAKHWRFRYKQLTGRENLLSFGPYPEISLAAARELRFNARRLLVQGIDPGIHREGQRRQLANNAANTFENVAREWHSVKQTSWSPNYAKNVLHRLVMDIFPNLGSRPIDEVTPRELIDVFRKIEERGAHEIAKRIKAVCSQIYSYAIQAGAAIRNPVADMKDILQTVTHGHFPAITTDGLPVFLDTLHKNEACMKATTRIGMRLLMLVFVRTSELIETPWDEIPLESGDWVIPWQRMKMGRRRKNPIKKDHVVPISRQVRTLFKELRAVTGGGKLLFPNVRDYSRPMSNNTLLKALERMGYKGDMSGHGFRALAMSTLKERLGYRHETIDLQLAHVKRDKNDRAYDRAEFIDERRKMMQDWADYIDAIEFRSCSRSVR